MVHRTGWRGIATAALLVAIVPSVALAEPYWIAYEGNDYPENEGWTRYATDPPAQRWLQDGSFFIDSRAGVHTVDNYTIYFDGGLDPEPGETFIMCWRLKIDEATPWEDPGVYVTSDDLYSVAYLFAEDYLLSLYEPSVYVQFEPGVFHEYELRSTDMRKYELYLDGHLVVNGVFFEGLFGAGDVTTVPYKQIVISAGEGAKAALAAYDYLTSKGLM